MPYSAIMKRASNLELPLEALVAIVELRGELDSLESAAVRAARERGATWEAVADALGVSRQAAYLRHGKDGGETRQRS